MGNVFSVRRPVMLEWIPVFVLVSAPAGAQDDPSAFFSKPTEQHKLLEREVGEFDVEIKMWMNGPEVEPAISKGKDKVTKLGELWILSDFEGEFGGVPFMGRGITGYDPMKGKFVGTWVDSLSSSMMLMEGDYDEGTRTLTMVSEGVDPSSKQKVKTKVSTKYLEDGKKLFTMSMAMPADAEYVKMFEMTYTKKK